MFKNPGGANDSAVFVLLKESSAYLSMSSQGSGAILTSNGEYSLKKIEKCSFLLQASLLSRSISGGEDSPSIEDNRLLLPKSLPVRNL